MPDVPSYVDRLIVHQFDPARPSPGGIDTCLRGIARYAPTTQKIAIVGVDAGSGERRRRLGEWETHQLGDNEILFLPVARVDPANQKRMIPHSLLLAWGLWRYRKSVPDAEVVQAHRMDTGLFLSYLRPRSRFAYYVHTQANGLTGKTSDSFWRKAAGIHSKLEKQTAKRAEEVVVFNEDYATTVSEWTSAARFSPTWYDPRLISAPETTRRPNSICWVGRAEVPKDPRLALAVLRELNESGSEWTLDLVGSGTLVSELKDQVSAWPVDLQKCVTIHGRLSPERTAAIMGTSSVFLMTSHPGYEGYPRVLVEALASGLPAVVTKGSDTGSLVRDGVTGFVGDRDASTLASQVRSAQGLNRTVIREVVADLSAPAVVRELFNAEASS